METGAVPNTFDAVTVRACSSSRSTRSLFSVSPSGLSGTKFVSWKRRSGSFSPEWRRAAYSSDSLAKATPAELTDLLDRLRATLEEWRDEIDHEDGQERESVFLFMHGFPTEP